MKESMEISEIHSHLNGYEWLSVHRPEVVPELQAGLEPFGIDNCDPAEVIGFLRRRGWQKGSRWEAIGRGVGVIVGLRGHHDLWLAKQLVQYERSQIEVGIQILPMAICIRDQLMRRHPIGPARFEDARTDLSRFGRGHPSVPLVLLAVR
ncbi:MAG: hypothetical protein WBC44_11915 [Planctomycetaceae bacterium]